LPFTAFRWNYTPAKPGLEQLAGKTLTKTRFGAIADKPDIWLISARTPQAKGRIERLRGTL
jgi:hypothetical protein